MLFKRKKKNRRITRSNVLDVKLSSDRIRASRIRLVSVSLGLVFATIFGFYLLWASGTMLLNHFIYQNKAFAIEKIDVQTDGVLSADQLRRWAEIKPGDNLMALDLSRVKRDMEMVSMIKSVAVERLLPNTLRLRVSEREAVAEAHLYRTRTNGGLDSIVLHIDPDGCVFSLPDIHQLADPQLQNTNPLPVITGTDVSDLIPGRHLASVNARAALDLLAALDVSPMAGLVEIQSINISSPQVLQVTTTHGNQVVFSAGDFDRQLRRWRVIQDQAAKLSKSVSTLDLSVPNSIPATLADVGNVPVQPVPLNKHIPRNPRKKNV